MRVNNHTAVLQSAKSQGTRTRVPNNLIKLKYSALIVLELIFDRSLITVSVRDMGRLVAKVSLVAEISFPLCSWDATDKTIGEVFGAPSSGHAYGWLPLTSTGTSSFGSLYR